MSDYTFTDGLKDIVNANFSDGKEATRRYDICKACVEHFNRVILTCGMCGCFMPAKVKLVNATCPAGKWS